MSFDHATRDFWDAAPCGTTGDADRRIDFLFRMEPWVRDVLDRVAAEPDVLEIGCGQGTHAAYLDRIMPPTSNYLGLDISAESVRVARQDSPRRRFMVASASSLPLPTASAPFVYSAGVLHHLPDPSEGIAEVYRVLQPGGRAIVALYRRGTIKNEVALAGRFTQRRLDSLLGTRNCICNLLRGRHFPQSLGTMLLEGFGVPYLYAYTRRGIERLLSDFEVLRLDTHGASLPFGPRVGGCYWVAEIRKPTAAAVAVS